jgi:hypothetical protein
MSEDEATKRQTPAGHRVLHVVVPEPVFWHVKAMALKSQLPLKLYLARFLAEALPMSLQPDTDTETPTEHSQRPAGGSV